jgi:hypothetical protein
VKYLMLVVIDETAEGPPPTEGETEAWVAEMDGRGVRVLGDAVRPAGEATSVRIRGGDVMVTDGPYAETKEQIAGFDILDCADLDEAIEVASKHPVARIGILDIRPFMEG